MATIKSEVQGAVSYTVSGLASLASGSYAVGNVITHSTNDPLDVLIDVSILGGVTTGNQQCVIFAVGSIDGTTFGRNVTESGFTSADEAEMHYVGSLPMVADSVQHKKIFSLSSAYGGVLPAASKLIFKNDTGVAFGATVAVQLAEVWGVAL